MYILIFSHIICYDIWFYITHIVLHHPSIYFIHKIHHKTSHKTLVYRDTNIAHSIENIIQPLGFIVPCFVYGISVYPILISWLIVCIRGLMRHDHRCSWLIGNHHILHHKYPNYNFGEYWIDTLCGTVYPYKDEYIYGKIYV